MLLFPVKAGNTNKVTRRPRCRVWISPLDCPLSICKFVCLSRDETKTTKLTFMKSCADLEHGQIEEPIQLCCASGSLSFSFLKNWKMLHLPWQKLGLLPFQLFYLHLCFSSLKMCCRGKTWSTQTQAADPQPNGWSSCTLQEKIFSQ